MLYRLLFVLLFFSISYAFDIRTGNYDNYFRLVIEPDDKGYQLLKCEEKNLIIRVSSNPQTFLKKNLKLNLKYIDAVEIFQNSYKNESIIIISLKEKITPKIFTLDKPYRVVVDFYLNNENIAKKENKEKPNKTDDKEDIVLSMLASAISNKSDLDDDMDLPKEKKFKGKKKVIVIDPGHGGKDAGATANGLVEKDINLKVAKMLKNYLEKDGRFTVYLTREDDTFIPLYDRTVFAIEKKADLFVSIHTNASENTALSGTYIYTLNLRGAQSKLAKMVEERENKAVLDIVKVSANPTVNKIVADLSISNTMTEGLNLAKTLEKYLRAETNFKRIDSANFAVLKTPGIPSVLVEIAFLTNPKDAEKLKDEEFLRNFSKNLYKGIASYFFSYKNYVFKGSNIN
ncbi:N-acetylmuramoyl-L-alanine amidase [Venenivibrio stagnispumantis]|uniref:N-acetylmuramoyl-L-alanine amidase n=1 Tax=Venenivibrio stagnispumantis TaxID=407998 RepID=A0AA45WMG9_9AQUI|nr:N-acetylmuramoyl-L-alanine amidase [Venenivibrio stagnispumantis]